MFALELLGMILLIVLLLAIAATLIIMFVKHLKQQNRTKYYIVNKTGNIFREYDTREERDRALEHFNNTWDWNFRAHDHKHTT